MSEETTPSRIVTSTKFFATFTGRSEFYSGVRHGEHVVLTVETVVYWYRDSQHPNVTPQRSSSHLSVQNLAEDSAHLGVSLDEVDSLLPYQCLAPDELRTLAAA